MNPDQLRYLEYMSALVGCSTALPESERRALEVWERYYIDGSGAFGTSDWPGWKRYIGPRPSPSPPQELTSRYVYLLKSGSSFKIGTTKSVSARISSLQTGNPNPIELVHAHFSDEARKVERDLHKTFAAKRIHGEWFTLDPDDIEYIIGLNV